MIKTVQAILAFVFLCGCTVPVKTSKSDHFDGKKFFNPGLSEDHGFWDVLKMLTTVKFEKWPEKVENNPDLRLQTVLGPGEVAITFVNHATVLLQLPGLTILTDPVWAQRASPLSWAGPKRVREPGIPFEQLPKIDVVLVSHNHYDHLDLATLKRLQDKFAPRFFVAMGDKALAESQGLSNVVEMDWWDSAVLDSGVKISFAPTQHFSARGPFDRNHSLWGSYVIESGGHRLYFGGDAGYSHHYKEIQRRFGPMDLSLLPIGAYEPRWFMKIVHMNPEEAVQAHVDLASRKSMGIHFGTFQLTEEKIDEPVRALAAELERRRIPADDFITLPEGVTTVFNLAKKEK